MNGASESWAPDVAGDEHMMMKMLLAEVNTLSEPESLMSMTAELVMVYETIFQMQWWDSR